MTPSLACPHCHATWSQDQTCEDYFHQLLCWEVEFPALGEVHHLTVVCYHLQHPQLYSPAGLAQAQTLLTEFVQQGLSPAWVRRRDRARVSSAQRRWKITATAQAHGAYDRPIAWTLTVADVVAGGPARYIESVRAWAKATWLALNTPVA